MSTPNDGGPALGAEREKCSECHGQGRVKVGWHPVAGSTYRIKVDYASCPKCSREATS